MRTFLTVQAHVDEVPCESRELWRKLASGEMDRLDASGQFRALLKSLEQRRAIPEALTR